MSTINLPAGVPAYQPATAKATGGNSIGTSAQEIQDNFMKMLMAQIQNQNPLDPAKPSEFTSQLSQLNTVKGISDLNQKMQSFLAQIKATDFMNLSQVVGRKALVEGNQFEFVGQPVVLGGELSADAQDVRATITDAYGRVMDQVSLGQAKSGSLRFQWDGLMGSGAIAQPGVYRLQLEAMASGGGNLTARTYTASDVASVGREGDKVSVRLADGRSVGADGVLEWLK